MDIPLYRYFYNKNIKVVGVDCILRHLVGHCKGCVKFEINDKSLHMKNGVLNIILWICFNIYLMYSYKLFVFLFVIIK